MSQQTCLLKFWSSLGGQTKWEKASVVNKRIYCPGDLNAGGLKVKYINLTFPALLCNVHKTFQPHWLNKQLRQSVLTEEDKPTHYSCSFEITGSLAHSLALQLSGKLTGCLIHDRMLVTLMRAPGSASVPQQRMWLLPVEKFSILRERHRTLTFFFTSLFLF